MGLKNKILLLSKISLPKFVWYNFFSRKVERHGKGYLIPYRYSVLDIARGAKIILHDGSFAINYFAPRHSKSEAHVRLDKNSVLEIDKSTTMYFSASIELKPDAKIFIGSAAINCFTRIVAAKSITIGHGVLIAPEVIMLDYDFHDILDENGVPTNPPRPIVIGDHVWLTSKCTVIRGSKIGDGSVISANSVVSGKIRGGVLAIGNPAKPVLEVSWNA